MNKVLGLTLLELTLLAVATVILASLASRQIENFRSSENDELRKSAINAMYYNLEEVYYSKNIYYPSSIDENVLTAMDPELFIDPDGAKLGEPGSDYRYDAIDCEADRCKSYRLVARLEKEADYVKRSRH